MYCAAVTWAKYYRCVSVANTYHRLCGSGTIVVTMTSKVNGTMEILTPYRPETPENIETRIGQNAVIGPFNPCQFS